MLDRELRTFGFFHGYARQLMADVTDDELCARPLPKLSHAAWLIGHLSYTHDRIAGLLGQPQRLGGRWPELFTAGAEVADDASVYPPRDELLAAYDAGHAQLPGVIAATSPEQFEAPNPYERLREGFPTLHDFVSFVLTGHEAMHLGQLSAWRRGLGRNPLF